MFHIPGVGARAHRFRATDTADQQTDWLIDRCILQTHKSAHQWTTWREARGRARYRAVRWTKEARRCAASTYPGAVRAASARHAAAADRLPAACVMTCSRVRPLRLMLSL